MTLKKLVILLGILVVLAGAGIMGLWQYAYSPQGRARVIIAQLKGDTTSLRGWMLRHHVIRPGFSAPTESDRDKLGAIYYSPYPYYEYPNTATAIDELVKLGPGALPTVIEALKDDDPKARIMAIQACGRFRDPIAIGPLAECVQAGIGGSNGPASLPAHLLSDVNAQNECVQSLRQLGPQALAPLLRLFEDSEYPVVHLYAAKALGELKDRRAADALLRRLSDQDHETAGSVAEALGEIGDPKAIPPLLKTLKDKRLRNSVRISAAGALARMKQDQGFQFLLAMAKSADPKDKANVADALGSPEIPGALAPLLSLLEDQHGDWVERAETVLAIGQLRDRRAIPALTKLLNESDPDIRRFAADGLEKLGVKPPPGSQPGKP